MHIHVRTYIEQVCVCVCCVYQVSLCHSIRYSWKSMRVHPQCVPAEDVNEKERKLERKEKRELDINCDH